MRKLLYYSLTIIVLFLVSCAKRGTITGGKKDSIAPIIVTSFPKNYATNFTAKEIKINFDEYIKLKDVSKQLIVSPPMKTAPEILPMNASKYITIKIKDTLKPNTTYNFNFGNSIQDNNEGNILQQFKYVFSTGATIDSLKIESRVKDAITQKKDNYVSLMLYEVNAKYSDSIVYKEPPLYITNSLDSIKLLKLENLKPGKYKLIALKDKNNNNKYDPNLDKIGFVNHYISVPNDTIFELKLFKQQLPFKGNNLSQASGLRATFGYEGNAKNTKITVRKGSENQEFIVSKLPKRDSLQVWFKAMKGDSLTVDVEKDSYKKTFGLKVKEQKKDTLGFKLDPAETLNFRETLSVFSTIPITAIDNSKIKLTDKAAKNVSFTTEYDEYNQRIKFNFKKEPDEKYSLIVLPEALTSFYGKKNDTLKYKFSTKNTTDFGNLKVVLENVKRYPIIVELTDKDGEKVLAKEYSEKSNVINFDLLEPNKYTLRVIYDDNKNKIWDAGNFLEHQQSEEVIYFPKELDVRANWDVEQPFDLK